MSYFNNSSRTRNAIKISLVGASANFLKIIFGFVYRTVFVRMLSETYLGVNGLFTSILTVLSLAELGVTTAILYRFYEPISRDDVHYVGMLMRFFKRVYSIIAIVILAMGLAIMPFIRFFIKDVSEVPADVNLYAAYLLFLANTLSSYIFSYKISLLSADQKNHVVSLINLLCDFLRYSVQILILALTRNYMFTLAIGIVITLLVNLVFSIIVTGKYKEVFSVKEMLPKEEQKKIFSDTRACMYHKVGSTVLSATDNAVLSKMISLTATGIYSNYAMLISSVQSLLIQLLGNFTASVGNAINKLSDDEYYALFRKAMFIGMWISSVVGVSFYAVVDDFVYVWVGERYVFDQVTTVVLCIQLYLSICRIINGSFIGASGLFVKDRIRPLIEAGLNLVISIALTYKFGITGVFLGTIFSNVLTVGWREPYILYKFCFKRSVADYWKMFIAFTIPAFGLAVGITLAKHYLIHLRPNLLVVIIEGLITFAVINVILFLMFRKRSEFKYFVTLVKGKVRRKRTGS